jgi:acetoin utilization deacetylase AcuC-like enzyme
MSAGWLAGCPGVRIGETGTMGSKTEAKRLAVMTNDGHDQHVVPEGHPEHSGRLHAAMDGIRAALEGADWVETSAPAATDEQLSIVHSPAYLDHLAADASAGGSRLDPDTHSSPGSLATARLAAGACLAAAGAMDSGSTRHALVAVRPPGHHALADRPMGFCLINNVAVAAATWADAGERVAIVDWDVHHGNGTQDIFFDDPRVLYVSTHQSPHYPGTGGLAETGGPNAERSNLNVPLRAGSAGDTLRAVFDEVIQPRIAEFAPTRLIISAGFDAHRDDPLAGLGLTAADYGALTERMIEVAPDGRLLVVMEGGYDLTALGRSIGSVAAVLAGVDLPTFDGESATSEGVDRDTLEAALAVHR